MLGSSQEIYFLLSTAILIKTPNNCPIVHGWSLPNAKQFCLLFCYQVQCIVCLSLGNIIATVLSASSMVLDVLAFMQLCAFKVIGAKYISYDL